MPIIRGAIFYRILEGSRSSWKNVVLFGAADSPSLFFFLSLRLAPLPPSSCLRSGSGAESVSNLQTVASAPAALLSACALRHTQQRHDLLGESAPTSSCGATEPPRNRIPPVLTHRHAQGLIDRAWFLVRHGALTAPQQCRILVVLCALQYFGQIVPEPLLHANSAAPGFASSPMTSPAPPHMLPPTVLSPASVFFLAYVCPPRHLPAATPLPPAPHLPPTVLLPLPCFSWHTFVPHRVSPPPHLSRQRHTSPVIAALFPLAPHSRSSRRKHRVRAAYKCALLHRQILYSVSTHWAVGDPGLNEVANAFRIARVFGAMRKDNCHAWGLWSGPQRDIVIPSHRMMKELKRSTKRPQKAKGVCVTHP
ncbi:hypothetical protein C8J57DRAFT_1476130 [Mycena rebaudengoi]|nr:hypothetical protein C8J57DRAFT_1476130 [Mycena rebaudengoi]